MERTMNNFYKALVASIFFTFGLINVANAACGDCDCAKCCEGKGGIRYSDTSAGRYVCNNGDYSTCYCTRHAIMDLQKLEGCCLWQGGVLKKTPTGIVVCRNGSFSELCSINYSR
jgi:hypothetical protein